MAIIVIVIAIILSVIANSLTTYKASRAAFSPSLIFILMSETSSRVEKEDNSNKNKTCSSWKKLSSSVKKHHRKLASYNGYGVVVILSGSYHAFCILCVLSILCTHRVWSGKKVFLTAAAGLAFLHFLSKFMEHMMIFQSGIQRSRGHNDAYSW